MRQMIYHLVGHKNFEQNAVFFQVLLFLHIAIFKKMYEKIEYHRMN